MVTKYKMVGYELNEEDIIEIIANHFETTTDNVKLENKITTVEIGASKQDICYLTCKVTKND